MKMMITSTDARNIDPKLSHLQDKELQKAIDSMYAVARLGLESLVIKKKRSAQLEDDSKTP